jgi:hypothetical protein
MENRCFHPWNPWNKTRSAREPPDCFSTEVEMKWNETKLHRTGESSSRSFEILPWAATALCCKVACSRPDEVNYYLFIFSIYVILPPALGPRIYSASNRNEYRKQKNNDSGSRKRPVRGADNITTICEPIVYSRQCGIYNISQPYRPPRPVTGIALL